MPDRFSEDRVLRYSQLREVIERAALMSDEDGVTVAELRSIAEELELDPGAVERALGQVLAEQDTGDPGQRISRAVASLLQVPSPTAMRSRRRHVFVMLAAAAALIVPGDSVVLTALLLAPMAVLYEVVVRLWAVARPTDDDRPSLGGAAPSTGLASADSVVVPPNDDPATPATLGRETLILNLT